LETAAFLPDARLCVISADAAPDRQGDVLRAAIDGGADIVQLRNKSAAKGELLAVARQLSTYAHSHRALFIVNDHVDLALACGADGVHLGQDDWAMRAARGSKRDSLLLGRSTHSLRQAQDAVRQGADYLGVGPVFATPTKPGRAPVGTALVGTVASEVEIPWFAIGGIDAHNIEQVLQAGATRVAVVRAVCDALDPAAAAAALKARLLAQVPA
jgi:thiamine-phosphate pyrophosphorylase